MLIKQLCVLLMALLVSGAAFAAGESDVKIRVGAIGSTVKIDHIIKDGKALVRVNSSRKAPLLGLKAADFSVIQSGRKGIVTSVQPFSENQDVPRHIVLVLDNSYSMYERKAIKSLLAGVSALLKTIRPIDDVQMVVFDNNKTVSMGGRNLHVQTFGSNQVAELRDFAVKAYSTEGLTGGTVLNEALLAGLYLCNKMPATEPRFMVVFSDGEDLNSAFKQDEVLLAAQSLKQFKLYAIDYMARPATDKFLTRLARDHGGQVWKATSETSLVSLFQKVASKMMHYYVVNYQFPATGALTVTPGKLTINEVATMGGAAPTTRIDVAALTLRPLVDTAYGIARWKVVVSNTKGSVSEMAGEGVPAAELKIALPSTDLKKLASNGDLSVNMELEDRIGQKLALSATPVKVALVQTRSSLTVSPASLKIEELKTIDVSPMLAHIYFAKGSGEILPQYVRFTAAAETAGFDEQKFTGSLEKYYQDLNIIGKRLTVRSDANITLIGCNDNSGPEKGNKKLSTLRAEAVRDYLKSIWNIAADRMTIEERNLPEKPSSIRLKDGQAENRRVEIVSTDTTILAPIRSTYLTTRIDASTLTLRSDIVAPHGIATWKITATNTTGTIANFSGKGVLAQETRIPLPSKDLKVLASGGDIAVKMELQDRMGQRMLLAPTPVTVNFIQTSQQLAQKQNLKIQEKYALVLFDFDKETIDTRNQEIITTIVARIQALPLATVDIVGHTDNIGTEEYNLKLSERRALAVYKLLSASFGELPGDRIRHTGAGQNSPLFDNVSPEARTFNRTVTITLEYLSAE
jgi:outer membrane protein OmpA-like peptidoglycan-associated protein/Mg-chelatase subunit ChlD